MIAMSSTSVESLARLMCVSSVGPTAIASWSRSSFFNLVPLVFTAVLFQFLCFAFRSPATIVGVAEFQLVVLQVGLYQVRCTLSIC